MKALRISILALLALALFAGAANAQRYMQGADERGRPYGGPDYYMNWDQRAGPRTNYESDYDAQSRRRLEQMWQSHVDEMAPLRSKLNNRYQELMDEMYSENPDEGRVDELIDEVNDLQARLFDKSARFKMEAYQKTGIPYRGGYGPGFCPGSRGAGYGPAYGQDGYGRGYGGGYQEGYGRGMDRGMGRGMMRDGRY